MKARSQVSFISQWSFAYFTALVKQGYKQDLIINDFPPIEDLDNSQYISEKLEKEWKSTGNLKITIVRVFGKRYARLFIWYLAEMGFKLGTAVLLGELLSWLTVGDNLSKGLLLAFGMLACKFMSMMIHHAEFFIATRMGMQLRVGFIGVVYKKCLLLSGSDSSITGVVVNIVSNDVQKFEDLAPFLGYLIIAPLEVILTTYLIYREISWAAFPAITTLFLFIPLQGVFAKMFGKIRESASKLRDERIKTLSDMFSGFLVIKLYGWEKPFIKKIQELRSLELKFIRKANHLRASNDAIFFSSSVIICLVAFVTFIYIGNFLTPQKVFVTLVLLQGVRLDMTLFFPRAVQCLAESLVSIRRIGEFLKMGNVNEKRDFGEFGKALDTLSADQKGLIMISFQTASFTWRAKSKFKSESSVTHVMTEVNSNQFVLKNISLNLMQGQLLGVCGMVGAGKSSLINAVLGELEPVDGSVLVRTKEIGYVGQSPWILSGSIKDNIIFGKEYKHDWFKLVIKNCALEEDLDRFPDHENTIVGERGVTLSGGQRARVALARAVYLDADIYLLDDPLSAVDAKVGRFIFDNCIRGVLKAKCIILVSHQLQYIKNCDMVALIEKGGLQGLGLYEEVMEVNAAFAKTMKDFATDPEKVNYIPQTTDQYIPEESSANELEDDKKNVAIIPEETIRKGAVNFSVYFQYLKADLPYYMLIFLLVAMIMGEALIISAIYWLGDMSEQSQQSQIENRDRNVYIYGGIVLATVIFSVIRAIWFYSNCIRSGRLFFSQMLHSVFRTPIDFFHINPHGRIMNRFSKDMNLIDEMLPATMFDFFQCLLMIVGSIAITGYVFPYLLLALPPLFVIFIFMRRYYLATSRQIKRLESITRSPVYSTIPATIEGLSVIRAFNAEERFARNLFHSQNENTRIFFCFLTSGRWLGVRLDFLAFTLLLIMAPISVTLRGQAGLNGGLVGLVLSFLLENIGLGQWCVRQSAEVENQMVAAERLQEYIQLSPEAEEVTSLRPPENWPSSGNITIKDMSLSYPRSTAPVLRNIAVNIKGGEKIGVVGRTGAGKSSLLQGLFRLVEPDPKGCVVIDGLDISSLGLLDLRSRLSIIPQEPFCFKGTLRFNLDPFDTFSDDDLWKALNLVELQPLVAGLPGKLDAPVEENGSNWSVGERQLICLARAILKNSKVIIMDEATSNVDIKTDACIQRAIRDEQVGIFSKCTVITIAHRLNTIIDYDKILVLEKGAVVEYGPPWELVKKPIEQNDAWFARLISELDPDIRQLLIRIALSKYKQ